MTKKKLFLLVSICFINIAVFYAQTGALVISVLGKVEVLQPQGQWKRISEGEKIGKGMVISTGFKSELTLQIGESFITVKPLTRLTLDQITERGDTLSSEVYLDAGAIKADVKAAENKRVGFKVISPVATASVRGTAGEIDSFGNLQGFRGAWSYQIGNFARELPSGYVVSTKSQDSSSSSKSSSSLPPSKTSTPTTKSQEVTVLPGQVASFNSTTNSVVLPQTNAVNSSVGTSGSSSLPSEQEKAGVNPASTSVSAQKVIVKPEKIKTTTVNVDVTFNY